MKRRGRRERGGGGSGEGGKRLPKAIPLLPPASPPTTRRPPPSSTPSTPSSPRSQIRRVSAQPSSAAAQAFSRCSAAPRRCLLICGDGGGRGHVRGGGAEVQGGEEAAVGEVRGGDPGPGEAGARVARHLRLRRGRGAGLRRRRAEPPRPARQNQLPARLLPPAPVAPLPPPREGGGGGAAGGRPRVQRELHRRVLERASRAQTGGHGGGGAPEAGPAARATGARRRLPQRLRLVGLRRGRRRRRLHRSVPRGGVRPQPPAAAGPGPRRPVHGPAALIGIHTESKQPEKTILLLVIFSQLDACIRLDNSLYHYSLRDN